MAIEFKEEVNVYDDGEFVGLIELEEGYAPIFRAEDGAVFDWSTLEKIATKLSDLDTRGL